MLRFLDLTGKTVWTDSLVYSGDFIYSCNLQFLQPGLYLVQVISEDDLVTKRLTINR